MKKHNSTTKPYACVNVLNIALLIILGWFITIYYYHVSKVDVPSVIPPKIIQPIIIIEPELIVPPEVKQPVLIPVAVESARKPIDYDALDDNIHIVFSTDCSFYQDWQTLLVFHSAMTIKQRGTVTRIASGCEDEKKEELIALYKKLFPQYHVHFTPDFKMDGKSKKKYDFYNKPYGVQHWLDKADPQVKSGVVVAILDPDMILLRPLTVRIKNEKNLINLYSFNAARDTVPDIIKAGQPAAQLYGLGAPWTTNSPNFNRSNVCGADSPCMKVERKFGEDHYSVGPPYILERDDLWRLTNSWTRMVPKVYDLYPELLAEMYAYSMAAAHEELPHFTAHHWMVSNTFAGDEGWPWVDPLGADVCEDPVDGVYYPGRPMPTTLHYCQFFRAGELGFQKRRIKPNIFQCDHPMMAEPPKNLGTVNYKNRDGTNMPLNQQQARRNAFMLCAIHKSINSMLVYYKQRMCPPGAANYNKSINVVDGKYWGR